MAAGEWLKLHLLSQLEKVLAVVFLSWFPSPIATNSCSCSRFPGGATTASFACGSARRLLSPSPTVFNAVLLCVWNGRSPGEGSVHPLHPGLRSSPGRRLTRGHPLAVHGMERDAGSFLAALISLPPGCTDPAFTAGTNRLR